MSSVRYGRTLAPPALLAPPRANDGFPYAPSDVVGRPIGSRYAKSEPYAGFIGMPSRVASPPSRRKATAFSGHEVDGIDCRLTSCVRRDGSSWSPASSIVTFSPASSSALAQATPAGPEPTTKITSWCGAYRACGAQRYPTVLVDLPVQRRPRVRPEDNCHDDCGADLGDGGCDGGHGLDLPHLRIVLRFDEIAQHLD